jgi:hypothetical protein
MTKQQSQLNEDVTVLKTEIEKQKERLLSLSLCFMELRDELEELQYQCLKKKKKKKK